MNKRRLKITPVLITINIFVIIIILSFYLIRMYYFYDKERIVVDSNTQITLYDMVISKESLVDLTTGLVKDKDEYRFKGMVENNYLEYSGFLFRILGIDSNNNITLVTEDNLTLIYSGLEKGFDNSYIKMWLNLDESENTGVFEKALFDKEKKLVKSLMCNDTIDDISNIVCNEVNDSNLITILSLYDYQKSGGKEGFLNNGNNYYLSTLNTSSNVYYVNNEGNVGVDVAITKIHGVRAKITLKKDTILISGNGSKNDPFKIEQHDIETINDTYIGDIIEYSGEQFTVISKEDNVKVVLNDKLKKDEEYLTSSFGGSNNIYSLNKNTIGNYLNNDYYSTLENNGYIVKSNWYVGKNTLDNLNYLEKYKSKVEANIGMLSLGDFYVNQGTNTLTITAGIESSQIINIVNEKNNIFGDYISTKYNIRPSFVLDKNIKIKHGKGTTEEPYELEFPNMEE